MNKLDEKVETRVVRGMKMVLEKDSGTRVFVARTVNRGNLECGFMMRVLDKNNNCSDAISFKRDADIIRRTAKLRNIADLTADDANEVGKYIIDNAEKINYITIGEKVNLRRMLKVLLDELKANGCNIKDGNYIISTDNFKLLIEGYGWTSLSIRKELDAAGLLKTNAGRLDLNISGENGRFVCIDAAALEKEAMLASDGQGAE